MFCVYDSSLSLRNASFQADDEELEIEKFEWNRKRRRRKRRRMRKSRKTSTNPMNVTRWFTFRFTTYPFWHFSQFIRSDGIKLKSKMALASASMSGIRPANRNQNRNKIVMNWTSQYVDLAHRLINYTCRTPIEITITAAATTTPTLTTTENCIALIAFAMSSVRCCCWRCYWCSFIW